MTKLFTLKKKVRKVHQGKIYDKERTKKKLISAVGKILMKEGHSGIRINRIEDVSKVSKKLIYDYFGGLNGLMKAYLKQVDFWKVNENAINSGDNLGLNNLDKDFIFNFLRENFNYLFNSVEMQKIILWGISEKNKSIRELSDDREALGELMFQTTDKVFSNTEVDFRATSLILVASIYYTVLHLKTNGSKMCGIDMKTTEGQERMFKAMDRLLALTYKYADEVF